jgi:tripartite-type tricarboxylate transporter receptor subunit TctC
MTRLVHAALLVALAFGVAAPATAQYPDKPITFVVPFAAGSATDQLARALGQEVTRITKQPVVVDDKPGASGFIGAEVVKKAAPDGYTVFITTNTTHAANQHLYKKIPYDPIADYLPVTGLGKGGQIMIVAPSVQAKSVAEFIALAKAQPGKISFGSGSSSSRVAGELFQQMAGVDLLHVPYKSNPLAINDLLGGQIQMMITDMATGLPQVKGGKVRALGVSTQKRSPLAPELPTIAEAGVPGYDMGFWFAAYVPANTPPASSRG